MIEIFRAHDPAEAHLVVALLEQNGIPAFVQGEALGAAAGGLPLGPGGAPSVWLRDDGDAEGAGQLIAAFCVPRNPEHCANCGYDLRGLPEPRCPECGQPFLRSVPQPPWKCAQCGEECEGQFTQCWRCGADRPGDAG